MIEVFTPEVYNKYAADDSRGPFSGIWSRKLRVKITGRDGFEKLDIQLPVSHRANNLYMHSFDIQIAVRHHVKNCTMSCAVSLVVRW